MKKQILVIHGGNAFEDYKEYLQYLRNRSISLATLQKNDWKRSLRVDLGDLYDVYTPQMPNSQNARYAEWKIWFDRLIKLFDEGVILIGHSLGGIFLAKYLSEQTSPISIKATFLVAAPFNTEHNHPLVDFNITQNLSHFEEQGGKIVLFHSSDDEIVPFSNLFSYQKELLESVSVTFNDRGHFLQPEFPELIDHIKQLG